MLMQTQVNNSKICPKIDELKDFVSSGINVNFPDNFIYVYFC